MIINDLDGYYIVFDTKNWNTELDTLIINTNRICVINNNRHTNFTRTSRDNLRNAISQNIC